MLTIISKMTVGSLIMIVMLMVLHMHPTPIAAQEVDEGEFDYVDGSPKGPARWGELKQEWKTCSQGRMQSPIYIFEFTTFLIPTRLQVNYKPSNATLKNRGHDIQMDWTGDAGSIRVNGVNYAFQKAHWHSPSEHFITGRRFALELHMVHASMDPNARNKFVVIAELYNLGQEDPFLTKIGDSLRVMANNGSVMEIDQGVVDPREIEIVRRRNYYTYQGSLTTPPCSEGVFWIVNGQINTVSVEQVALLRDAVQDNARENARPIQPLNGRIVNFQLL